MQHLIVLFAQNAEFISVTESDIDSNR